MAGILDWKLLGEGAPLDFHIFRLRTLKVADPRNGAEYPRVVLEAGDWVNVVAVTPSDEVVLVRQFRFGTWAPTLEIPGGMVDPGEAPAAAAARELLEETGFRPRELVLLGASHPNPAMLNNRLHTFLATGCEQVHGGAPEASEDLEVCLVPRARLPAMVQSGEISHCLVLAALLLEGLHRR